MLFRAYLALEYVAMDILGPLLEEVKYQVVLAGNDETVFETNEGGNGV